MQLQPPQIEPIQLAGTSTATVRKNNWNFPFIKIIFEFKFDLENVLPNVNSKEINKYIDSCKLRHLTATFERNLLFNAFNLSVSIEFKSHRKHLQIIW